MMILWLLLLFWVVSCSLFLIQECPIFCQDYLMLSCQISLTQPIDKIKLSLLLIAVKENTTFRELWWYLRGSKPRSKCEDLKFSLSLKWWWWGLIKIEYHNSLELVETARQGFENCWWLPIEEMMGLSWSFCNEQSSYTHARVSWNSRVTLMRTLD